MCRCAWKWPTTVKLGKLVKHGGFVSDALAGWPTIRVRWQIGLWGVVKGLEKNGFCGADYQIWKGLRGFLMLTALGVVPIAGMLFAADGSRLLYAGLFAAQAGPARHGRTAQRLVIPCMAWRFGLLRGDWVRIAAIDGAGAVARRDHLAGDVVSVG